jgi:hypothetical protein
MVPWWYLTPDIIAFAIVLLIYTPLFLFQWTKVCAIKFACPICYNCNLSSYFSDIVSNHNLLFLILARACKQHMRCGFAYQVYVVLFFSKW